MLRYSKLVKRTGCNCAEVSTCYVEGSKGITGIGCYLYVNVTVYVIKICNNFCAILILIECQSSVSVRRSDLSVVNGVIYSNCNSLIRCCQIINAICKRNRNCNVYACAFSRECVFAKSYRNVAPVCVSNSTCNSILYSFCSNCINIFCIEGNVSCVDSSCRTGFCQETGDLKSCSRNFATGYFCYLEYFVLLHIHIQFKTLSLNGLLTKTSCHRNGIFVRIVISFTKNGIKYFSLQVCFSCA